MVLTESGKPALIKYKGDDRDNSYSERKDEMFALRIMNADS